MKTIYGQCDYIPVEVVRLILDHRRRRLAAEAAAETRGQGEEAQDENDLWSM